MGIKPHCVHKNAQVIEFNLSNFDFNFIAQNKGMFFNWQISSIFLSFYWNTKQTKSTQPHFMINHLTIKNYFFEKVDSTTFFDVITNENSKKRWNKNLSLKAETIPHTHSIKNRSKGRGIFMLPLFCMIIGPRRTINNDRTSKIKCYNHFTLIFTVTHFWQVNHRNRLTKKRFVIDLMSFKFQPNPFAWTPGLQVSGKTSNLFFKKIQSVFLLYETCFFLWLRWKWYFEIASFCLFVGSANFAILQSNIYRFA